MEYSLFQQLSLIIAIAAVVSLVMKALRQPLIIGYIITGLLVGPIFLNIAHESETLTVFAEIGIALLLFLVGLGLSPKVIKEVGKVAVLTGLGQVLFTTIIGYFLVVLLTDLSTLAAIYVALGLSFSSTIIVLKLLNDKKEQNRLYGKIAIGFLIVQDIIAAFALIFVTATSKGSIDANDVLVLVAKGFMLFAILYILSAQILPRLNKLISSSQELLFLFAIGWGLSIAAVFKYAGFSLEVGALAAGVAMSQFSYAQEAGSRLKPLRDFFIVLFFVILGSQLNLQSSLETLPLAITLSLFVLIGNPIIVMIIMGTLGYTKKTSFKTSLVVAQISEFSLVLLLLANKAGQIDEKTLSMMTIVGLITIAVSSYMILYDEKLYLVFERYLGVFERKKTRYEGQKNQNNDVLLFGYKKGGSEFAKIFKKLGYKFAVIDYDPEIIETLEKSSINYLYGDMTDLELLDEANIGSVKLVVTVTSDHETNKFLLGIVEQMNPNCVVVLYADSIERASELYELGASYVMLPHYIGSEKIGAFITKNGLKKSEFKKYRDKHITYLLTHYIESESENS